MNTNQQYDKVISQCRKVFSDKLKDYGASWRIFRPTSLTDQIYIKANRIRNIQIKGSHEVDEGITPEFIGIINYSVIALIQLELSFGEAANLSPEKCLELYDKYTSSAHELMKKKNSDYGEAWRNLRISSMVDLILTKILRLKQIEDNNGKTIASEGPDANYYDILNYAVFSMIRMDEDC